MRSIPSSHPWVGTIEWVTDQPKKRKRRSSFPTARVVESVGNALFGFRPNVLEDVVGEHGALSGVSWFIRHMPRYRLILKSWGALRTHLVTTVIAVTGGSPSCAGGHALAFQLHYLKHFDQLFTLDEAELLALSSIDEEEAIDKLFDALRLDGLQREIPVLQRLMELHAGASAHSAEDSDLLHLMSMFAAVAHLKSDDASFAKGDDDGTHDPINRDETLRARYAQLRKRAAHK